jgi:Tfp pilus assembly protein PilN
MIIRNNLASAPVKNYSLFLFGCLALAIVGILFTIWNVVSLMNSYSESADLNKKISLQQKQLNELDQKAKQLKSRIERIKTPRFIAETEFMNQAIKRRTFSWTALFDHFEEVLPPTVKMISITPSVTEEQIAINLELAAQTLADMLELVRLMERDPAFSRVVLKGERMDPNDAQIYFTISLNYNPSQRIPNSADTSTLPTKQAAGPPMVPAPVGGTR